MWAAVLFEVYTIMKTRFWLTIGILWIALGAFLSSPFWLANFHAQTTSAAAAVDISRPMNTDKPIVEGTPSRIAFPELHIDKTVIPGAFNEKTKSWTLSDYDAQFATATSLPNNKTGNTFIYGHNNLKTFGKLLDAQLGIEAVVTTTNGHVFQYRLVSKTDVQPNDTTFLATHQSPILTVQTCSGLWSETRRMFVFELTEAR